MEINNTRYILSDYERKMSLYIASFFVHMINYITVTEIMKYNKVRKKKKVEKFKSRSSVSQNINKYYMQLKYYYIVENSRQKYYDLINEQ